MNTQLILLLSSYLKGEINIDYLRHWIALNVWDRSVEARDIMDQVAVELAYIDDGSSDEERFRIRMADVLAPTLVLTLNERKDKIDTLMSSSDRRGEFIFRVETPGKVESLQVAHAFE